MLVDYKYIIHLNLICIRVRYFSKSQLSLFCKINRLSDALNILEFA